MGVPADPTRLLRTAHLAADDGPQSTADPTKLNRPKKTCQPHCLKKPPAIHLAPTKKAASDPHGNEAAPLRLTDVCCPVRLSSPVTRGVGSVGGPLETSPHHRGGFGRGQSSPHAAGGSLPLPWGVGAAFFVGANLVGGGILRCLAEERAAMMSVPLSSPVGVAMPPDRERSAGVPADPTRLVIPPSQPSAAESSPSAASAFPARRRTSAHWGDPQAG